jgi:hypothetical protein
LAFIFKKHKNSLYITCSALCASAQDPTASVHLVLYETKVEVGFDLNLRPLLERLEHLPGATLLQVHFKLPGQIELEYQKLNPTVVKRN